MINPPSVYTPKDGEKWEQAKRVARVSAALHAELDVHLAQTHMNTEQYAIAAYRNLRKSPLRYLLFPHLKEVVLINHEADSWLLGDKGFITRSQALTKEALNTRLKQVVGTLDWKNWQPRKKVCENHTYAVAAQKFWETLTEAVNDFFTEYRTTIHKHWYEVHRFSQDLVEHSVPMFLCEHLKKCLLDKKGQPRKSGAEWYETNERMDLSLPRENGKAISPIATTSDPTDEAIENMKQVCRYVIFHATFFHYWPNSRQMDDGGEIVYSGLGLRHGKKECGIMTSEHDYSVAPPPQRASEQLWFANALTKTTFGHIMANEDRDIHPILIAELRTRKKAFEALGIDIAKIPSRPNI